MQIKFAMANEEMLRRAFLSAYIVSGYGRYFILHNVFPIIYFNTTLLRTYESYFNREFIAEEIGDNIRILEH